MAVRADFHTNNILFSGLVKYSINCLHSKNVKVIKIQKNAFKTIFFDLKMLLKQFSLT